MTSSLAHYLQYAALRGAVAPLGLLGWRRASDLGAAIGRQGYRPLGIRRGVVERQIRAAFPEHDEAWVVKTARGAYESLGRTTMETAVLPTLPPGAVLDLFSGTRGWDAVQSAREGGKGLIIVAGHIGNWELGGAFVAASGVPLDAVVRRMSNPLFDRYLNSTRAQIGMRVVPDADAVRHTPRALRENRAVVFVSDQGVLGLASTFVPFFGRPAKTPRGPAVFALRLDVPMVFASAIRQPDGSFHMLFEPIPAQRTGDREADVNAIVASYTQALERHVRETPDQYFWHHRRWRRQPPETPPELREP